MPGLNIKPLGQIGRNFAGWRITRITVFSMLLAAALAGPIGWTGRLSPAGRLNATSGIAGSGPEKTIVLIVRHSADSDIPRPALAYRRVVQVPAVLPKPPAVGWLGTGLAIILAGLALRRGTKLNFNR